MTLSIIEWTLQLFYIITEVCRTGRSSDPCSSTFPPQLEQHPRIQGSAGRMMLCTSPFRAVLPKPLSLKPAFPWSDLNQMLVKRVDFMKQMQPHPPEHTREDVSTFAFERLEELWPASNLKTECFIPDRVWYRLVRLYWMTENGKHKCSNIYW